MLIHITSCPWPASHDAVLSVTDVTPHQTFKMQCKKWHNKITTMNNSAHEEKFGNFHHWLYIPRYHEQLCHHSGTTVEVRKTSGGLKDPW